MRLVSDPSFRLPRIGAIIAAAALVLSSVTVGTPAFAAEEATVVEQSVDSGENAPAADAPAADVPAQDAPAEDVPAFVETPTDETSTEGTPVDPAAGPAAPAPALRVGGASMMAAESAAVSVSVVSADGAGVVLSAEVSGLTPAELPNGVHVGTLPASVELSAARTPDFLGSVGSVRPADLPADGAFTLELTIPTAELTRDAELNVLVWMRHTNPSAATNVASTAVALSPAEWDAIFGALPAVPAVAVSVVSADAAGLVLSADVSGLTPSDLPNGVHVGALPASVAVESAVSSDFLGTPGSVRPADLPADGAFSLEVTVPAAKLTRGDALNVLVWMRHTNPSAGTNLVSAEVVLTPEQWDAIFGAVPAVAVSVVSADATGLVLSAEVSGLTPSDLPNGVHVGALPTSVEVTAARTPDFLGTVGSVRPADLPADGAFTLELTIPTAELTRDAELNVLVWMRHTNPSAATNVASTAVALSPAEWDAIFGTIPVVSVSKTSGLDRTGETVTATGTGYDPTKAIYVAVCEDRALSDVNFAMLSSCFGPRLVTPTPTADTHVQLSPDGSFAFEFEVLAGASAFEQPAVFTLRNHLGMADRTQDAKVLVAFTAAPVAPPTPTAPVTSGALSWGIKSSFVSYITTTAHGTITTNGVGTSGGVYQFGQSGANGIDAAAGTGSVAYSGSVRYTGHNGALDLTFANPSITLTSTSSATLYTTVNGSSVALATLALGSGVRTANGWAGVPATLTAAGADAFEGFYGAGERLDPVTFAAGIASGPLGGTTTVAAVERTPAATPPATQGAQFVGTQRPTAGGEVTITADGFQPNESGILIVIYSTPVVLGTASADANGVVTWTGRLPGTLTGTHTLTLQGSVDRGMIVEIGESAMSRMLKGCTAETASLSWGLKETWRSYVSGTIAHGKWEVADGATYATPLFGWTGAGTIDPEQLTGLLEFEGSIRFTGHDGILDTTLADPRIVFEGDRATLLFDVEGFNRAGEAVTQEDVEFGALDLAAAEVSYDEATGILTLAAIPAELLALGAAAISYPAGDPLDPLTIEVQLDDACAVAPGGAPTVSDETAEVTPISAGPDLTWLWWTLGALALVLAIIVTVLVVRRRGSNA